MHLPHSGLAIIIVFGVLDTISAHTQPQPLMRSSLLASNKHVTIKTRLLRSNDMNIVGDTNTEYKVHSDERASLPKLAQLDQATWRLRKLDMQLSEKVWLAIGYTPATLFKTFRLGKGTKSIADSKKLLQWLRFTQTYRKKKGVYRFSDETAISLLEKCIPHAQMTVLFQDLKSIPDLKHFAERLQKRGRHS